MWERSSDWPAGRLEKHIFLLGSAALNSTGFLWLAAWVPMGSFALPPGFLWVPMAVSVPRAGVMLLCFGISELIQTSLLSRI